MFRNGVLTTHKVIKKINYQSLCNPGPIFSIPGFGIETFLIPGSRRDYVTTIIPLPHISHRPQFTHKSGHGLVRTWYC
jgi:hypothetical protein